MQKYCGKIKVMIIAFRNKEKESFNVLQFVTNLT